MDAPLENPVKKPKKKSPELLKILSAAAIVIAACGISFFAGTAYQKNKQPTLVQNTIGGFSDDQGFSGRGGGIRQNGVIGSVTAVTATSITVNNQRTGTSSTKTINDTTIITNNGTKVTASDIKVGDNVFIRTSTSDTTIATNIDINPTMPMGRPQSSTSTTDDSQLETQTN